MTNLGTPPDNTTATTRVIDATGDETPQVQSKRRRTRLIAIIAAAALVLAGGVTGGILYANHLAETRRLESLAACEKELKQFKAALKDLDQARADVAETVKITAGQVADETTVEELASAVALEAPGAVAYPADATVEVLEANGAKLAEGARGVEAGIAAIADGAARVVESKTAKEIADAQKRLSDEIAAGERALKDSEGKVADNAVRQQLRDALDEAIGAKDSRDVRALGAQTDGITGRVKAVGDAVAAKARADAEAEAQAVAAAQAAANARKNAGSYKNTGTTTKKNTTSNGNGTTTQKSTGTTGNSGGSTSSGNNSGGGSSGGTGQREFIPIPQPEICKANYNNCS